jgi:hypothetical protein
MNKEFETNKKLINNKISNDKLDIQKLEEDMNKLNNNIKLLTITIDKETKIEDDITILENKIQKYKEIIIQSEKDLRTLV